MDQHLITNLVSTNFFKKFNSNMAATLQLTNFVISIAWSQWNLK